MRIKRKFLQLTRKTYPKGTESQLEGFLPDGYKKDSYGNYYLVLGTEPDCMFACHLDTYSKLEQQITHKFKGNFIMSDGTTILGADDKAGMIVLLYMIEKKVPGLYYFFLAEESGCLGSKEVAESFECGYPMIPELKKITKCISFDRKGTNSIITEQLFTECCSKEFAYGLANRLNSVGNGLTMMPDATGVSTDSAQFMGIIPECTNISVGYYDEHTSSERQDIDFLYKLCHAVVEINWQTLPVSRIPEGPYYKYYNPSPIRKKVNTGLEDWDAPWDFSNYLEPNSVSDFKLRFSKDNYTWKVDPFDNKRKLVYISKVWITHETFLLRQAFGKIGLNLKELRWDGTSCWILEHGYTIMDYWGSRKDVSIYLDNCGEIPAHHMLYEDENIRQYLMKNYLSLS